MSKLRASIDKILTWPLLALTLTPLVVTPSVMFPYVFGKVVFIRFAITFFWLFLTIFLFVSNTQEIKDRLNFSFIRKPTFILVLLFTISGLVSTMFAENAYRAFFGNVERGEGMLTYLFLFLFLVGTLMIFRKKEWMAFLKTSLFVGLVVAVDAILFFITRNVRADGSFIGNPIFVADYLLFTIFVALLILADVRGKFWRILAYAAIPLALLGIGATESRGVLVGIFMAIVFLMIYFITNDKKINFKLRSKPIGTRAVGLFLLGAIFVVISSFVLTKNNPFWQNVPGFDRLAIISGNDIGTGVRLVTTGISLNSVNPSVWGVQKLLIGWGPENYINAYFNNFDPRLLKYEPEWHDRAHNKVLDVLVMQGLIGLLLFLALWGKLLVNGFKKKVVSGDHLSQEGRGEYLTSMGIIFFAVAYFVQNLFVFDSIVTLVPIFVFLGFVIYEREYGRESTFLDQYKNFIFFRVFTILVTGGLILSLFLHSIIPFYQLSEFTKSGSSQSAENISENLSRITQPYNYVQAEIRFSFINNAPNWIRVAEAIPLTLSLHDLAREVTLKEPPDPRMLRSLGYFETALGRLTENPELFALAETDYREALKLVPGRQAIMLDLASNLVSQGRIDEAHVIAKEILDLEPDSLYGQYYYGAIIAPYDWDRELGGLSMIEAIYKENKFVKLGAKDISGQAQIPLLRDAYSSYLYLFYEERNTNAFIKTMEQAILLETLIEENQQRLLEEGIIQQAVLSNVENIQNGLRVFRKDGWSSVSS